MENTYYDLLNTYHKLLDFETRRLVEIAKDNKVENGLIDKTIKSLECITDKPGFDTIYNLQELENCLLDKELIDSNVMQGLVDIIEKHFDLLGLIKVSKTDADTLDALAKIEDKLLYEISNADLNKLQSVTNQLNKILPDYELNHQKRELCEKC